MWMTQVVKNVSKFSVVTPRLAVFKLLLDNKRAIVSWAILIVATAVYSDRCVKLIVYH